MSRKSENASFTADKNLLHKARDKAAQTERGNFSAYIEKVLTRDLRDWPAKKKATA